MKDRRLHFCGGRIPTRKRKHSPLDWDYTGNYHIRIIMAYGSDTHAVILGYFLTLRGNQGPLEKYQWKHFEEGEVWLLKIDIGHTEQEIKDFTDYLDAHGIKWI